MPINTVQLTREGSEPVVDHVTPELVDTASLPPDSEMRAGWRTFIASLQRPAAQARARALIDQGLGLPGELEQQLNEYTAKFEEKK
jgi:hypothetical protein